MPVVREDDASDTDMDYRQHHCGLTPELSRAEGVGLNELLCGGHK